MKLNTITLIDKLSKIEELNPDEHDGSYELARELIGALNNISIEEISIIDLDMLYLMVLGTWKYSYDNKKRKVRESHLKNEDKEKIIILIDNLEKNAVNHKYQNRNNDEPTIGMFGSGFLSFKSKVSENDARKFIKLCLEIVKMDGEDQVLNLVDNYFKKEIKGFRTATASVSQILHCLKPNIFPVLNKAEDAGIEVYKQLGVNLKIPEKIENYIYNVRAIREFRNKYCSFKNYRVIDMLLWEKIEGYNDCGYWLLNVYFKNNDDNVWNYCKNNSCFAMQYQYDKEDNSSVTRNLNSAKEVKIGDYCIAYTGVNSSIIGAGKITKEFYEETDSSKFIDNDKPWAQRLGVSWEIVSDTPLVVKDFVKTMDIDKQVNLSSYTINSTTQKGYLYVRSLLNDNKTSVELSSDINYWWLNAKPTIWSFDQINVGETIEYTSHTDEGTKRRVYKNFDEAIAGDVVLGYETSPTKAIVAICKVVREHDGETIEFEKVKKLENPIPLDLIREIQELTAMQSLHQPIGSFFKIKPNEYEILMELIDNYNPKAEEAPDMYTKAMFLNEVFFSDEKYEQIMLDLDYKKNIILQGPPGVGKTFVAKRLAYSRMRRKEESKIQMIQFHQNYSYEDFIQGYRPTDDGKFKLKNGIFYEFCRKAQRDPSNDYYFVIDEINRGNLSKIFGELMMLMESDKRGKEFAIPLTYSQSEEEKFFIPENLYLIGTMNTADRSLAMVDYALRRRFSFENIEPAFYTDEFSKFMKLKGLEIKLLDKIVQKIGQLNEKICSDRNLGKGYQIGHSYFCCTPKSGDSQEEWYRRIIISEIRSLLFEYWFDDEETAQIELNKLI